MACFNVKTEAAKLIVQSCKDFRIDLNAKDDSGKWAFLFSLLLTALFFSKSDKTTSSLKL